MSDKNAINSQVFAMGLIEWFSEKTQQGWISAEATDRFLGVGNTWEQAGFECLADFYTPYGDVFTYVKKN